MAHGLNDKDKVQTCIIDPVSPEFNRGSFCHLPYHIYSAKKSIGEDVVLFENFSAVDIDSLPNAETYLIGLWSHPQIEQVETLLRFLPAGRCKVFGYTPLIKARHLPSYVPTPAELRRGLEEYVRYQNEFRYVLLSDCDMHLKEYEGRVIPVYTSYGCPNGCAFCPSTANWNKRIILDEELVIRNFEILKERNAQGIHFFDEDLFFDIDRLYRLCLALEKIGGFHLIGLSTHKSCQRFIDRYGCEPLHKAGFKLIEIGLETASVSLAKSMGKGGSEPCARLKEACSIPILWLTMTFFPGETIRTLNETGEFLRVYGLRRDKLWERLATNGTRGGLGQFFQAYEGTKGFDALVGKGVVLTDRPLRLMPSFVPFSFLHDIIMEARAVREEEHIWYDTYHVDPSLGLEAGKTIGRAAVEGWPSPVDGYIALAISARLGVIQ